MERETRGGREPQSLEAWATWVDKLIVEAQERGDFDNLPGHGKPITIEESPFADGRELGFGILKNAGVAPVWVELEKEIREKTARMEELLSHAAAAAARDQPERRPLEPPEPVSLRWWWPFGRRERIRAEPVPAVDRRAVDLARFRRAYLELAGERAGTIAQFNAAIPRELWQLERPRETRDDAARVFDAVVDAGG